MYLNTDKLITGVNNNLNILRCLIYIYMNVLKRFNQF